MARKKKEKKTEVVEITREEEISNLLDSCKNRFTEVLIIGISSDNSLDVLTSAPRYDYMQYMIGRAEYELHAHEMNSILSTRRSAEAVEAEIDETQAIHEDG